MFYSKKIKKNNLEYKTDKGFTLMEVMVSVTIFTVIITFGIEAVLNAMAQHNLTNNMRNVMDELNFVMEDMARNIRSGSEIRCVTSSNDGGHAVYIESGTYGSTNDVIPSNCPLDPLGSGEGSNKIVFKSSSGTNITYVITPPSATTPIIANQIYKKTGDDDTDNGQDITPPEVTIDYYNSGFYVSGALPAPVVTGGGADTTHDLRQPTVTIHLSGYITYKTRKSTFSIQTTATVRNLDL